eukprot:6183768-Pleurochrysis_carterae.AAC.2
MSRPGACAHARVDVRDRLAAITHEVDTAPVESLPTVRTLLSRAQPAPLPEPLGRHNSVRPPRTHAWVC